MNRFGDMVGGGLAVVLLLWLLWCGIERPGGGWGSAAVGEPAAAGVGSAGPAGRGDVPEGWVSMVPVDGQGSWRRVDYGGGGEARWEEGVLVIEAGVMLSGVRWEGALPATPFEIELEARRTSGSDFFCGLTVPARGPEGCITWVVGGWGGGVVGISSIDDLDASGNETASYRQFENGRWYRLRLAVREDRLEAWIDGEQVLGVDTEFRRLGLRPGSIEMSAPLGLASWQTGAELRGVRWRRLP